MSDLVIDLDMNDSEQEVDIELQNGGDVDLSFGATVEVGGTKDYRRLTNKPSINGEELVGNYDEIDPTVPNWAKEETKPAYTAEEIGAIDEDDEMSFSTIKDVWDSIFLSKGE